MLASNLPPESSLMRAASDGDSAWTLPVQLQATIVDLLAGANWQRAGKGPKPEPLKRPGARPEKKVLGGGESMPRDELDRLLAAYVGGRWAEKGGG